MKCQALDIDGKRCQKMGKERTKYHGDTEIYDKIKWVSVWFCEEHLAQQ